MAGVPLSARPGHREHSYVPHKASVVENQSLVNITRLAAFFNELPSLLDLLMLCVQDSPSGSRLTRLKSRLP
jgi:hypothetical protein